MTSVNIIIADDDAYIHESIKQSLDSLNFPYTVIKNFYYLDDLVDYLFDEMTTEEGADILILDNLFYGSSSNTGIKALADIREAAPRLPILMLSTMSDDEGDFSNARDIYNIDYIQKPVRAGDLRFRIGMIINVMNSWDTLHAKFLENEELLKIFSEEIDSIKAQNTSLQQELEEKVSGSIKKLLPIDLIQKLFPDVEILPKAFRFLLKGGITNTDWNKIFRCLKVIDWGSETFKSHGITMEKFKQGLQWGYKNIWEYRFSRGGRIFVERQENALPQIVLIDPYHKYSDLNEF